MSSIRVGLIGILIGVLIPAAAALCLVEFFDCEPAFGQAGR